MPKLRWTDVDEIGSQLHEELPHLDPLSVRFTDLRAHVLSLPDFTDDPAASNEHHLEAIQMAWLEYHREQGQ